MPTSDPTVGPVPVALHVVFGLVLVESLAESAFVIARDDFGPGGKGLLVGVFAVKVGFAELTRRRSAAGVLGLLTFELVGILVALGADWSLTIRYLLVACVALVYVLVLTSLRAFPSPDLPVR